MKRSTTCSQARRAKRYPASGSQTTDLMVSSKAICGKRFAAVLRRQLLDRQLLRASAAADARPKRIVGAEHPDTPVFRKKPRAYFASCARHNASARTAIFV